jgi:hypothetical protein
VPRPEDLLHFTIGLCASTALKALLLHLAITGLKGPFFHRNPEYTNYEHAYKVPLDKAY